MNTKGKEPLRVLFIGNSYTFFNETWTQFANIANSEGRLVIIDKVVHGGYFLYQMLDPEDETGREVKRKLENNVYDVAVIQEQSCGTLTDHDRFIKNVGEFAEIFKKKNIRGILFQTWGRKEGHEVLTKNGWTNKSMTDGIRAAYREAGEKYGLEVSPVGDAFFDVYTKSPQIDLYYKDGHHESEAGTYLVSLCHYATIFGVTPLGVKFEFGVGSHDEALVLQRAAAKACGFEEE